jgi:putative protease
MIKKELELLAPAKDYECAIEAINAGADAVYIGATKFGARYNAGNNLESIGKLIEYGHKFRVKIYVTVNTILYDNELDEAKKLIWDLYDLLADAIIIQDFGLLELELPPIPLFASTQMHNHTIERIQFLEKVGIQRAILARELSLNEIKEIRANTNIDLEFFIHGSLCVSFSGQCYLSQVMNRRSGNRGQCAQPCRMRYDLIDKNGNILAKDKYLLSLKDLNLSQHLNDLVSAGITSFKIEGRLKDRNYVKNITAFYRKKLDEIIRDDNSLKQSSMGKSNFDFEANPYKSFNRGFTTYFIENRKPDIISLDTAKSIGERIGTVKFVDKKYFTLKEDHDLHNGDGICYYDRSGILSGININKVENGKIYPPRMIELTPGTVIYRNFDSQFEKILENDRTVRKILIEMEFGENPEGFYLIAKDKEGTEVKLEIKCAKVAAREEAKSFEVVKKQISSLGNTIYEVSKLNVKLDRGCFFNLKILNGMRRELISKFDEERSKRYCRKTVKIEPNDYPYPEKELDYKANISNEKALNFMQRHGAVVNEKAFELLDDSSGKEIMVVRHCLKFQFGSCPTYHNKGKSLQEYSWYLINNRNKYQLEFDCEKCQMIIKS